LIYGLLALLVALAQSPAYSCPMSSTRPTTGLILEVHNLEIRPASSTRLATSPCSPNE